MMRSVCGTRAEQRAEAEAEQVRGRDGGKGRPGTAGSQAVGQAGRLTLKVMGKSSTFTWLSKSPAALLLLLLEAMLLQVAQIQLQLKWNGNGL